MRMRIMLSIGGLGGYVNQILLRWIPDRMTIAILYPHCHSMFCYHVYKET